MIRVEGLRYRYPGADADTLHGLDVAVGRGEIFGFLGPSGAGKSTTQKILIGLLEGYRGSVTVMGRPLADWGRALYRHLGVSFEQPNHYLKLTARENLALFAALHGGAADPEPLLDAVGLADDADRRVGGFSKGMRGRLSVVRALQHEPELIFLDEPTSGLDPVTTEAVRRLIVAQRARGATVVLTTHDMALAEGLCDRVAFLVDGRVALIDTPWALKLAHGRRTVRVETARGRGREFPLEGLADDPAFLTLLRGGVETLHSQETSLERIFVSVTGRELM